MAQIVVKCPKSGNLVPTGKTVDREAWDTATFKDNSFVCPDCGNIHRWEKEDAQLKDG